MSGSGKPRAMIAMSGGVDSSVAALLAMRKGYECEGVTMNLFADAAGAEDAKRAADRLAIPHRVVDLSKEFDEHVIGPFVSSYENGETPNPCIECNRHIKFGALYEYARAAGFDVLVTGHYAVIEEGPFGTYRLKRARDAGKDQSYFLYSLGAEELGHIWFPLGELTKAEARVMAREAGLESAEKPESQDICFIPHGDHAGFIENYRGAPSAEGDFVDTEGRVLGRHSGIERYTIGQRKKLGVALGRSVFVKEIRPLTGEVVLAEESEVFSSGIVLEDVVWRGPARSNTEGRETGSASLRAEIVIRYRAKPVPASVVWAPDGRVSIEFDEPVRAPARGQTAVMYDGDCVIGGGRIAAVSGTKL